MFCGLLPNESSATKNAIRSSGVNSSVLKHILKNGLLHNLMTETYAVGFKYLVYNYQFSINNCIKKNYFWSRAGKVV